MYDSLEFLTGKPCCLQNDKATDFKLTSNEVEIPCSRFLLVRLTSLLMELFPRFIRQLYSFNNKTDNGSRAFSR